ncbi:TBC-domain-containing protein [Haematococcus lacustris]
MSSRTAAPSDTSRPAQRSEDYLGFNITRPLTPQQQADRLESNKEAESRSSEWAKFASKRQLPSASRLKKLVRQGGVPAAHRAWVWSEVSGANAMRSDHPSNYFRRLSTSSQASEASIRQIDLDLPRTYPEHQWLCSVTGQASLCSVLLAYSIHNPQVGYCQGLNFVAAMLLVSTDKQPETAFWLLTALLERILYINNYSPDLPGFQVEMLTLTDLVKEKLPKLHKHLQDLSCEMQILATDWYLTLYATSLPPEVAVRVWDCLFVEGSKVLYRVALALLQLYQPVLLSHDNAGEVLQNLDAAATGHYNTKRLLRTAFNRIGSLPMEKINRIRHSQQQVVDKMLQKRAVERRKRELAEARKAAQRKAEQEALQRVEAGGALDMGFGAV